MSPLRVIAVRTIGTLWVAALTFLALAQPAHALFGSPTAALLTQALGAVLLAAGFALRGPVLRQRERFGAFLVRSRGLRTAVRSLAVGTLAAPAAEEAGAGATSGTEAMTPEPSQAVLSQWQEPGGFSSAATAETSLQTAASAPHRPIPAFPTTTA